MGGNEPLQNNFFGEQSSPVRCVQKLNKTSYHSALPELSDDELKLKLSFNLPEPEFVARVRLISEQKKPGQTELSPDPTWLLVVVKDRTSALLPRNSLLP